MKRIAILGSTGSIGRSALSIVSAYPERFTVVSLAAGNDHEGLFRQALRYKPRLVSVAKEEDALQVRDGLEMSGLTGIEVVHGTAGNVAVATHPDVEFVISAMSLVQGLSRRFWYLHYKEAADMPLAARLHADVARTIARGDGDAAGRASDALMDYIEDFARATVGID